MLGLAMAAGPEDRQAPLKSYCNGLLLPRDRKSIEPMAARLDPENVQPNAPEPAPFGGQGFVER
jgi:SRSO17 transposase